MSSFVRSLGKPSTWRATTVAMVALVVAGLLLRARGFLFGSGSLWWDEASWALELVEKSGEFDYLRPVGFMAVVRGLALLFGASEHVLRLLPWLAGMVTVLIAPPIAARLFSNVAARLLFVSILALHPAAIDLSKEFKPYAVSLALHAGLLLSTLRYLANTRGSDLAVALVVATLGPLFAQDMTFAYPGTFLLLVAAARARGRAHVGAVLLSGGLIIALLGGSYFFIWRHIAASEVGFWARKYSVFYDESTKSSYLAWLSDQYRGLRELPGARREFWSSSLLSREALEGVSQADAIFWSIVHFVGLLAIAVGRRGRDALLVGLPFVVLFAFNALHFWPMGAFRANLFTLLYLSAIAGCALDWPFPALKTKVAAFAALAAVVVPLLSFESDWHATKRASSNDGSLKAVLARIEELRLKENHPETEPLLLSSSACAEWHYYSRIHPSAGKFRRRVEQWFTPRCVHTGTVGEELSRAVSSESRVWAVFYQRQDPVRIASKFPELEVLYREQVGLLRFAAFRRSRVKQPITR